MSNQIGKLAAEIDAAIRPYLFNREPLDPELRERLSDLLWQLGEAAGEAAEEKTVQEPPAPVPAPATKEDLEELSRQLEWLSQEQSATRRKVAELVETDCRRLEALRRSDEARANGHARSFFTGAGLAMALTPALVCGCYLLFGLVRKVAGGTENFFLFLLSILICVALGIVLSLGAGALSGRLRRWLEKITDVEDFEKEE